MRNLDRRTGDSGSSYKRLLVIGILALLMYLAIIVRLFFIQVVAHDFYQDLADRQQRRTADFTAARGEIYARDHTNSDSDELYPIAKNQILYEVFLVPNDITRPVNVAELLAETLDVDYDIILERAKKENDVYERIATRVTEDQVRIIQESGLAGIETRKEVWRYYPDKAVGSHIIGFYGLADDLKVGRYGIEGFWEDEIAGISEQATVLRDASGSIIPTADGEINTAIDGTDIILTIDRTIQFEVCKILKNGIDRYAADKGTVIIIESRTGKILSMCNYPSFDPNEYNKVEDVGYYNNDAVYEAYEPGSVFKPIAMSIAIDQEKVEPSTVYEDSGSVTINEFTIRNFDQQAHGVKTMTEVLQESLNTGIIFATEEVDNRIYYDYIKKFGFGENTGIRLSQEVPGSLGELSSGQDIYKATTSFGQGLTVTPLQMLAAINVLANDGVLIKPYIVDETIKSSGERTVTETTNVRRVISKKTADTITAMLVRVAEEGYDSKASVPGYYVAGKTGTAQIAEKGRYGDRTNHTFVGYGPAIDSKFSVLIKLHNVKNVRFASDSTTPLFHEIARFLLQYYKIPPSR